MWRMKGKYVASCSCRLICPCPVDGTPTGPGNTCTGSAVFRVDEGNLNETDLSGVVFAFYNMFPSNLSSGNWKLGVVVDESASDEQTDAVARILGGQEGGPFAEFVPLIGEFLGVERGTVTISDGEKPTASVQGRTEISLDVLMGPIGGPTTVKNAFFGFAPEYTLARASGSSNSFGLSYDGVYGETAEFDYTDQTTEVHPRA